MKRQTTKSIILSVALGSILTLIWIFCSQANNRARQLADGSWLKIQNVVVAEEISRHLPEGNLIQRLFERFAPGWVRSIMPWSLRSKVFSQSSADLHMSGDGKVCLFIVTARDGIGPTSELDLKFLAISDDQGQGTNTSTPLVTLNTQCKLQGWAWADFPKYSRILIVRCWGTGPKGPLVEVAQFKIRNPGYEPQGQRKAL